MIDVSFLLLIFFLVTTTFERAEGILASRLPEARGTPTVALPISPIVLRLTQIGPGYDDYAIRIDRFREIPIESAELGDHLRQIHQLPGFDIQTPVVIVAENDVRWDHVVSCWNAAVGVGCERIAFAEP
jgi:biopolymer transport protein ExbD